ncbi:hypothetical protein [Embleya sp. NBC_00896]|uniref:hypothetical protein n=1 Tax=Embleya sp. NBC_00896 TaxID=2975961 RepID=UPI0038652055|nr:hypothetical protein OG928_10010 [Embleya sp. NBC_00896]
MIERGTPHRQLPPAVPAGAVGFPSRVDVGPAERGGRDGELPGRDGDYDLT